MNRYKKFQQNIVESMDDAIAALVYEKNDAAIVRIYQTMNNDYRSKYLHKLPNVNRLYRAWKGVRNYVFDRIFEIMKYEEVRNDILNDSSNLPILQSMINTLYIVIVANLSSDTFKYDDLHALIAELKKDLKLRSV